MNKDFEKRTIVIKLPPEIWERLHKCAEKDYRPLSTFVAKLLTDYISLNLK